jgi:hypothetical protein
MFEVTTEVVMVILYQLMLSLSMLLTQVFLMLIYSLQHQMRKQRPVRRAAPGADTLPAASRA